MTIHLLGSMATSPNLASNLERALIYLEPDILTVENSQEWIEFQKQHKEEIRKYSMYLFREGGFDSNIVKHAEAYINLKETNFDVEISRKYAYANENNIHLHFIGDPRNLEDLYDSLKIRMKKLFFSLPLALPNTNLQDSNLGEVAEKTRYQVFEDLISGDIYLEELIPELAEFTISSIDEKRNNYAANNLSQLVRENPNKKLVNVGNPLNLVDDIRNRTLYSKLKHLNPERSTIIRY